MSRLAPAISIVLAAFALPASAQDLIVVGNDGKFVGLSGPIGSPRPAPNDSIVIIDASKSPPAIVKTVPGLNHSIQGPPQSVAITPDQRLAFVGAPTTFDFSAKREVPENSLQIVSLHGNAPLQTVDLGAQPNGLSVDPAGKLLLAACIDGTVKVLAIQAGTAHLIKTIKVSDRRLSGISFTHDGKAAIVAHRDEGGLSVLDVTGSDVTLSEDRVSTGVGPLDVEISSDGRYAVVGNIGMTTLAGVRGRLAGDADSFTLVDVSKRPFRAIQHVTVPSAPEGVAISPDGRWIAVQSLDGSHLPPGNPRRKESGQVLLFALRNGKATLVNSVPGGAISQGIVFSRDGRRVFVNRNVERELAVYEIRGGRLSDTILRIPMGMSSVSIASAPR